MSSSPEATLGRKRDSEATRAALLEAARDLFGRHGYDAVTLREIGERAGADGSLVARYFGNKAALYRSAMAEESREVNASPETSDLAAFTAYAVRRVDGRGAPGPIVQALFSHGNTPEVRASAAQEVRAKLVAPLAARLADEGAADPVAKAEVLIACVVGVLALRPTGLFDGLSAISPEEVGTILDSAIQALPPAVK
ncbi:TetR/AcrR family transcriptional regulator [Streptomyces sp. Tu 4128]|uniref:TetR/AcrR family transcriptional regulator n=1 Tax=Streptomyces sp. Tu 4128 TaxID=1120314 RepID=UPI000F032A25|nr:TetR/AcrR family transcriptional regulator [Streptomyces sp. Tu 4128]